MSIVEQILITYESLIQFGFEKHSGVWFLNNIALWDGDLCIEYGEGRYEVKAECVYYLDQLKDAYLKITGEELKIK
jgi:hypothetical protein